MRDFDSDALLTPIDANVSLVPRTRAHSSAKD
jgi:hypothetical protein